MKIENTLSRNITSAGDKASYDDACKRLLANKMILAWIMKSCLKEYKNCSIQDIVEKYIEGEPEVSKTAVHPDETNRETGESIHGVSNEDNTVTEGTIKYDIRFFAIVPSSEEVIRLIINIESQNDFYPGYPIIKRAIYYCCRMISAQYGTVFTESHYEKVRKVYSVWVCLSPPKHRENSISKYLIKEEQMIGKGKEKEQDYDLITAIMICLGKEEDTNYQGILKLLDTLLSTKKKPESKKQILQEEFDIAMTTEIESEVSLMCNLSDGIERQGIEIGKEIGEGIGEERGTKKTKLQDIQNLMKNLKFSMEQAMAALEVPEADREKYAAMLKS